MGKDTFIGGESSITYNRKDIKHIRVVNAKYFDEDIAPFIRVKKGTTIYRLFRKNIHFEEDGFKLDSSCNGRYGGWHNKYYYSVKDMVDAIKSHWGEMSNGGYYSHIPIAEYSAGRNIATSKECIYHDQDRNCIAIKPHVILYFDDDITETFTCGGHYIPRKEVKIFDTNEEAEHYYKELITTHITNIWASKERVYQFQDFLGRVHTETALKNLRGVFIHDNKLPITTVEDPYFEERIKMLEGEYLAESKYLGLLETIKTDFCENINKFLEHRHSVKDQILAHILNSEEYKAMLADSSPLKDYKPIVGSNELYTEQQDGCYFISYDMIKANFQALRYINPLIVRCCESWEEFVASFTNVKYLASAKQMRQEVLGKLNGKRLAAIEKFISNKFGRIMDDHLFLEPFSIKTDEVIFKFNGWSKKYDGQDIVKEFEKFPVRDEEFEGFKFRVNKFRLHMRTFKRPFSDKLINVYEKEDFLDGHRRILKGVPAAYYPQVYKLLHGIKINDSDLVYSYEHDLSKFMRPIELIK